MTDELFPRKKSLIICSSTVIPTPEKTINIKMSMNIMNNKEKMVFLLNINKKIWLCEVY